ncbi:vitamin D3 hydroxylase-associated protein-like isoform 2-T2 [Mantella aurantiaca]
MSDCDDQLRKLREREERGALYGVPVSIKEQVGYQGHPSTCGLAQYLDVPEAEDCVIVRVLKKQGAVIFAKTNVPQSLICYETSNPIYGYTKNPHNRKKGASGSSGGEGALIGGGASILGIGSDIAGSIRLPSSFCGIAGFMPSPRRLSIRGVRSAIDGMTAVRLSIGPMARDVDALVVVMRALLCDEMFRLDPYVPPIPFNEEVFSRRNSLRIGYYEEDGFFLPNPGMRRVLLETKKLLEEAGHQLVRFCPPGVDSAYEMLLRVAFLGDGGETLADKFKDNIVDVHLAESVTLYNLPAMMKKILALLLRPLAPRISKAMYSCVGPRSIREHWLDHVALEAVSDGVGLPLSVQCVALPYQDELCLRLMKEVQTLNMRQLKR